MSDVKRYEEEYGGVGERADGIYVKYEDYEALKKKLDAAEAKADCYEKSAKYAAATNKKLTAKMSAMCDTIQQLKHQLEEKSRG